MNMLIVGAELDYASSLIHHLNQSADQIWGIPWHAIQGEPNPHLPIKWVEDAPLYLGGELLDLILFLCPMNLPKSSEQQLREQLQSILFNRRSNLLKSSNPKIVFLHDQAFDLKIEWLTKGIWALKSEGIGLTVIEIQSGFDIANTFHFEDLCQSLEIILQLSNQSNINHLALANRY